MEPRDHLGALERGTERLLSAAAGALALAVPSCPGWDVADLVVHTGLVWGWAARIVETGRRAARDDGPVERDEGVLLEWARTNSARVVSALTAADPDDACWTFGPPGTKRFWIRRQALETALHAWDAEAASGRASALDPELAADGVDELLTVILPRRLSAEPADWADWAGEALHLHRTDGDGEWLVRLGPSGALDVVGAHGKGDVALRGTAATLWLWATNRATPDESGVEVMGERSVAERWTASFRF